jgi:hypothetical protein
VKQGILIDQGFWAFLDSFSLAICWEHCELTSNARGVQGKNEKKCSSGQIGSLSDRISGRRYLNLPLVWLGKLVGLPASILSIIRARHEVHHPEQASATAGFNTNAEKFWHVGGEGLILPSTP